MDDDKQRTARMVDHGGHVPAVGGNDRRDDRQRESGVVMNYVRKIKLANCGEFEVVYDVSSSENNWKNIIKSERSKFASDPDASAYMLLADGKKSVVIEWVSVIKTRDVNDDAR